MRALVPLLYFSVLSLFLMTGFFGSNTLPDVHDPTLAFRTQLTLDLLHVPQLPPAWHNTLNYGHGYPLNLYYAPLITFLTSLTSALSGNIVLGIKLSLWLATLVGAYGVYHLINKRQGLAGYVAGTAYALLPYHASALYVRGSYAEYLALSLLPWVIYFWIKPLNQSKYIAWAASISALFLISHNTLPFLALPLVIIISLLLQPRNFKYLFATAILSLTLPALFLFPVFFERNLIQVEQIATATRLTDHFVLPSQLWYSPWGYGGSSPGDGDLMSFMLGKGQVILGILGMCLALFVRDYRALVLTTPLLLTLFGTFSLSAPIWQLVPALNVLQFPWRLLGIATLGISLSAGSLFSHLKHRLAPAFAVFAILALILTNYLYFRPWNMLTYNHDILTSPNNLYPLVAHKIPEYLPAWMPSFPTTPPSDGLTRTSTTVSGTLTHSTLAPLTIQTAYMPHWKLRLNNYPTDILPAENGTIRTHAPIPPGTYSVSLTWHLTTLEILGVITSLISLLIVLGLAL